MSRPARDVVGRRLVPGRRRRGRAHLHGAAMNFNRPASADAESAVERLLASRSFARAGHRPSRALRWADGPPTPRTDRIQPPTRRGWPRRRPSRSSSRSCRSSTRIITCGTAPDHRYLLHELLADAAHRPQRRRHRVPRVPRDVPRGGPARDAAGGRDRVRGRHGRDERQRACTGRRAWPRASWASPTSRWATASSRCCEAHIRAGGGRFRGVRHSAAWDASDVIGNSAAADGPAPLPAAGLPRRPRAPHRARAVARRLGVPSAARRRGRPGPRVPDGQHHRGPRAAGRSATGPTPASATRSSRPGRPAMTELAAVPERDA